MLNSFISFVMVGMQRFLIVKNLGYGQQQLSRAEEKSSGYRHGPYARFWVEPERKREFETTTDIHRCIWAWRRHVSTILEQAKTLPEDQYHELRYEDLASDPIKEAQRLLSYLEIEDPASKEILKNAFLKARGDSVGSGKRELWQRSSNKFTRKQVLCLRSWDMLTESSQSRPSQIQSLSPVFLVGCPRSGTTLLQQLLDAHPDIAIAPETHFIRNFWLKRKDYGDLTNDANYQALLEAICNIPEFVEMELSIAAFRDAAQNVERNYASLLDLLLEQFCQNRNTKIVGEKTPNHLLYMQTLQEFFPTARFIHIVRDPRAVVNSWKTVPWSTGSISGDAEVWRRYMATARQSPPDSRAVFILHYEQLISESEECLKKLCHFLDLQFDVKMLNYHASRSTRVNITREPWKGNAVTPVSNKSLTRWQQELTKAEVATIELVAGEEMSQFGYDLQSARWDILRANVRRHTQQKLARIRKYMQRLTNL